MKLRHIACAFGRHQVDREAIRRIHGQQVGRCTHCSTPLEELYRDVWAVQQVKDAGLGNRVLR